MDPVARAFKESLSIHKSKKHFEKTTIQLRVILIGKKMHSIYMYYFPRMFLAK